MKRSTKEINLGGNSMKYYNAIGNRPYSQREEWVDNGNGNYCNVYFRIDTIGFDCVNGCFDKEDDRKAFYEEATQIISKFGIIESSGFRQNNEYLYAHPQNISGIVAKSKIKAVAEAIDNCDTMSIRWVDVYEEYAIISDDDYKEILDGKRTEIIRCIIENCRTKRTNLYHSSFSVAVDVQERFKENRINDIENINKHGMTYKYIVGVIKWLVENNYLVTAKDEYIRSLNKTEQKKTE